MQRLVIASFAVMIMTLFGPVGLADQHRPHATADTPLVTAEAVPAPSTASAAGPVARHSVHMKVDAKVYGNPYAPANAGQKPVPPLAGVDVSSIEPQDAPGGHDAVPTPHEAVSRLAAERSAARLLALVEERVVTDRAPVRFMV